MVEEGQPGVPLDAASLKATRASQLRAMEPVAIDAILSSIRQAETIPKVDYHFAQHGPEFSARVSAEYLERLREHVQRHDSRVFTFLRQPDRVPFWALVAPDTGATVLYHEQRKAVWSFYRPTIPAVRFGKVQSDWIELVRRGERWDIEEDWQWER